jgi:hypothetical protein
MCGSHLAGCTRFGKGRSERCRVNGRLVQHVLAVAAVRGAPAVASVHGAGIGGPASTRPVVKAQQAGCLGSMSMQLWAGELFGACAPDHAVPFCFAVFDLPGSGRGWSPPLAGMHAEDNHMQLSTASYLQAQNTDARTCEQTLFPLLSSFFHGRAPTGAWNH